MRGHFSKSISKTWDTRFEAVNDGCDSQAGAQGSRQCRTLHCADITGLNSGGLPWFLGPGRCGSRESNPCTCYWTDTQPHTQPRHPQTDCTGQFSARIPSGDFEIPGTFPSGAWSFFLTYSHLVFAIASEGPLLTIFDPRTSTMAHSTPTPPKFSPPRIAVPATGSQSLSIVSWV